MYFLQRKLNPDLDGADAGTGEVAPEAVEVETAPEKKADGGEGGQPLSFPPFEIADESGNAHPITSPDDLLGFVGRYTESQVTPLTKELETLRQQSAQDRQLLAQLQAQQVNRATSGNDAPIVGDDFDINLPDDYDPLDPESQKAALKMVAKEMLKRTSGMRGTVEKQVEEYMRAAEQERANADVIKTIVGEVRKAVPSMTISDDQILQYAQKLNNDPVALAKMVAAHIQSGTKNSAKFTLRPISTATGQNGAGALPAGAAPNEISEAKAEWDKMQNTPGYSAIMESNNKTKFNKILEIAVDQGWE